MDANMQLTINTFTQLFPHKFPPPDISLIFSKIPDISLTAVKFPDIFRFSIPVVTLNIRTFMECLSNAVHISFHGEPAVHVNRPWPTQGESIIAVTAH